MKLIALGLLALATIALADGPKKPENFEQMKADKLAHFDQRIGVLQTAKSCVQAATTIDAIKACHKDMRGKMKEMHKERQSRRKEKKK